MGAAIALVLFLPVMVVIAILIKRESPETAACVVDWA